MADTLGSISEIPVRQFDSGRCPFLTSDRGHLVRFTYHITATATDF
jgi:hypothetical protein